MKIRLFLIVALQLGWAIENAGCRQATRPDASNTAQAGKLQIASGTPSYATAAFDVKSERLPPGYKGHDIEAVCDSAEYPTGKALDGLYAFKLESSLDGKVTDALSFSLKRTYTREHLVERMSLRTVSIPVWGETSKEPWAPLGSVRGIIIKNRSFSSQYIGQNTFSAKVSVTKLDVEQFNIALSKVPGPFTTNLEVGRLRDVLFICKLRPPLFHKGYSKTDPTFTDPFDVTTKHKVLYVELTAIWIYDSETGEVLRKLH